ncbi:OLC1v1021183C1 [Oldenlandia corymbosa var. corymbosa]|uniref:OLC1v1021183C1 n=1 Tax=Oldenlandia corymbosa var. corymbosa TaxID=529605 RepID=A0AAV1BV38_OLDCO|nr:OLC1v1021183C1 [Oldenlandia corymbosa var. corymbosa]
MKSRTRCRTSTSPSTPSFYRCYLKPGALAQMRNSKITAKSMAKDPPSLLSQIEPTISSDLVVNYDSMELVPCFAFRFNDRRRNHPRCLIRKKLVPVMPVFTES